MPTGGSDHSDRRRKGKGLAFRAAGPADVDAVVELVESAYRGDSSRAGWTTEADLLDGQRTDRDQVLALLGRPASQVVLAESLAESLAETSPDGPSEEAPHLLGCCHIQRSAEGSEAYFGMFAVRPHLQGRGVGRAVIGEARRLAGEWGCTTLRMTVIRQRVELIDWYRRLGFEPTGATEPFPYGDERFGLPRRDDLEFVVLAGPTDLP